MKHLILSTAFTVICCCAFAQTKKFDSAKKTIPTSPVHSALIQEKIWPEPYSNFKNKGSIIIKPTSILELRGRL